MLGFYKIARFQIYFLKTNVANVVSEGLNVRVFETVRESRLKYVNAIETIFLQCFNGALQI